ncbi:MAG TPA: CoA pyrophosphatase [Acidimicrobiales bacterium]|nr:CoA pyrophosphatase [Acidimicrobiales bacterium]
MERVRAALRTVGPSEPTEQLPYRAASAAVLIPLFEEDGETRVVLTRRSPALRSHTHQVSFPGGRLDEDEGPLAAALREASEEVGLDPADVEILGQLTPLATLSKGAHITPFVGVLEGRPVLRPNPAEVEHAFDIALVELLDESVYGEELWEMPGMGERPMHFFTLPHDIVWGATARILYELLELVALTGRTGPRPAGR